MFLIFTTQLYSCLCNYNAIIFISLQEGSIATGILLTPNTSLSSLPVGIKIIFLYHDTCVCALEIIVIFRQPWAFLTPPLSRSPQIQSTSCSIRFTTIAFLGDFFRPHRPPPAKTAIFFVIVVFLATLFSRMFTGERCLLLTSLD